MVNGTQNSTTNISSGKLEEAYRVLWLVGLVISLFGLLMKIVLFWLIPKCRKFDEKLLFQLSLARTLNTGCEYHILCIPFTNTIVLDIIYALYMQTDFILVLWMFIFSKNLYNKVVLVFPNDKPRLIYITALVWIGTVPIGVLCVFFLETKTYFSEYYQVYSHIKLLITVVNALVFIRIFKIAIKRRSSTSRSAKHMIKTSIVAFILVCITSLQVFITDILSFYYYKYTILINIFCVVNSYQVIAISIIFIILTKSKTKESVIRTMSIKLKKIVTP